VICACAKSRLKNPLAAFLLALSCAELNWLKEAIYSLFATESNQIIFRFVSCKVKLWLLESSSLSNHHGLGADPRNHSSVALPLRIANISEPILRLKMLFDLKISLIKML